MLMGMFPANALLYRRGYLRESEPVIREERTLDSLWKREPPRIDDNEIYGADTRSLEELARARRSDGRLSRAAFLVGRVEMALTDAPRPTHVTDISPYLDGAAGTIRSATGELLWNYQTGLCRMDAPCAQGVVGFLKSAGGRFELSDVTIESGNEYAAVSVVSLDGEPLRGSQRVLVQVGTTARLDGWKTEPSVFEFQKQMIHGERIVNTGTPPWQIVNTSVALSISNSNMSRATLLDLAGHKAGELDVVRSGNEMSLTLPPQAMYVLLE
jgi:hypothetical protein